MGDPPADGILPLEKIAGYLKSTIDELRHISARLRPKDLDSLGLKGAIREICRRIEGQYQEISVSFQFYIEEEDVSDAIKLVIYRIMQEAVTNAAKHASAKNVNVVIAKDGDCVHLSVEDDGCGFDQRTTSATDLPGGGYGLKNMRDRAEFNDGSLHVTSTPGAGTRVRAVLPLAGPEAE
jgi:signal transduction histidine kinase